MKEVLEIIAKSLVDYPEQVDVKEINNEDQTVTLELRVAESDMGKVCLLYTSPSPRDCS